MRPNDTDKEPPPMVDLRDLICTAERLQAKGFTRRAAAAWRIVANHEDTTDEARDAYWKRIDKETARRLAEDRPERITTTLNAARNAKILAMLRAGIPRAKVCAEMGVSMAVTRSVLKSSQLDEIH